MVGIADIEKILKDKFKDTPINVVVEYTSHQKQNDMIKVEFWFPIFSFEKRWWEKCGCNFFMSEESRCIENVELLAKDAVLKYYEALVDLNRACYK